MRYASYKPALCALVFFFFVFPGASTQQTRHSKHDGHDQTVWNYEGGVLFETDGSLPNGACFRIHGQMNSGDFFDRLKRIDTGEATTFRRGTETVTTFPDSVTVSFAIRDFCPAEVQQMGIRPFLTQKMVDDLRLSIYWKHGVELQPVKGVKEIDARVDRIQPYATSLANELTPRYEWSYELEVPSAGVPLMDSLAFVFHTQDGRIAARVAARL
ncbi:MAG TPA: hypothetical protein VEU98_04625 [Candidatus Eremiobacteraceae bacterium]|nr:hypothetical protein [Candidatus Eremiobacteraceae bacterium]